MGGHSALAENSDNHAKEAGKARLSGLFSDALPAYFFLATATLCWGANAVLGRLAVDNISPLLLVTSRWLGVALLIVVFLRGPLKRDWPILKQHLGYLVALGSFGFTFFNALFYIAAHTTEAINIGILQGSIPIFVVLGTFLFYRQRVTLLQALGIALTVLGVMLIAGQGSLARLAALEIQEGDFLMILACALYAGYAVGLQKRPKVSPISLFSIMALAALAASLPFSVGEYLLGNFQAPTAQGWLVILLVTLFPSFLAQIFFIKGVDALGPSRAGVFANLVPVYASVMAVLFLGESFETFHAAALVLVLSGIWISERFKQSA